MRTVGVLAISSNRGWKSQAIAVASAPAPAEREEPGVFEYRYNNAPADDSSDGASHVDSALEQKLERRSGAERGRPAPPPPPTSVKARCRFFHQSAPVTVTRRFPR